MISIRRWFRGDRPTRTTLRQRNRVCPAVEGLESRVVLYSATGNIWPSQQLITISFMPDGTNLGGGYTSNLMSTFNSKSSLGNWENVILRAAQTWAQQTNINFAVVPDDGAAAGSGADEQGNPGFGDIRIGGYNFGSSTLALTYQPPSANNFSIAGNMTFNTGQSFNIGSTYDVFTVAMHEFGHALGLGESSVGNAVEYGTYTGRKTGLASDDIAGVRSIYSANGPRTADAYNTNGSSNGTVSTAATINSLINTSSLTVLVPNLDITTAGQSEYFSFTAPSGTGGTLETRRPEQRPEPAGAEGDRVRLERLDRGGQCERGGSIRDDAHGERLRRHRGRVVLGVGAGGRYDPDGHGPLCPGPELQGREPAHGGLAQRGGAQRQSRARRRRPGRRFVVARLRHRQSRHRRDQPRQRRQQQRWRDQHPVTSPSSARRRPLTSSPSTPMALRSDRRSPCSTTRGITITRQPSSPTASTTSRPWRPISTGYSTLLSYPYQVVIDTHVPNPPVLNDISPDTGLSSTDGITDVNTPTFSGSTEPFAVINLFSNGSSQPFGTTQADISGFWSSRSVNRGGHVFGASSGSGSRIRVGDSVRLLGSSIGAGRRPPAVTPPPRPVLPDGTYNVTATAMDIAGTTSAIVVDVDGRHRHATATGTRVIGISINTSSNQDGVTRHTT